MNTISRDDRVVNSRDRATSILRKLGIDRTQYGQYIDGLPDHRFNVKLSLVYAQRADLPTAKSTAKSTTKSTVASICLDVFKRNGSNADAWEAVKAAVEIDDSKKWYAGWYRGYFKRRGRL